MHDTKDPLSRRTRVIAGVALTALYAAGLALMCLGNLQAGLGLWGISTVGGMGLLWYAARRRREAEDEKLRAEVEEAERTKAQE